MIKFVSILTLSIVFLNSINAQIRKQKDKVIWLQADIDFEKGNYPSALTKYQELYELDSSNQSILYNMGQCMYFLKFDLQETQSYFEKVDPSKHPDVDYYLGNINLKLRNYPEAISHLERYNETSASNRLYNSNEVELLMRKIITAEKFEALGNQKVQIENLGAKVNTRYPDYAPLINYKNNQLIFSSRRTNNVFEFKGAYYSALDKIYECTYTSEGWSDPQTIEPLLDYNVHNAATSISFDGSKILFYRSSEDNITGHIFESELVNGLWSQPQLLGFNINSIENTEPSACYSNDDDIIFFASDRPGGYGGKDIYYVKKLPNGNWGTPFNLGPEINTAYNEDGPFLHPVTNDLYFSSQGHENMGGYDVFVSSFNEKGEFEEPQNLGYPINSSSDDIFYTVNYDFSEGFVSSDRMGGYGSTDIYKLSYNEDQLPIEVYSVLVQNSDSEILKNVEISLIDKATQKKLGLYRSNNISGKTLIIAEPNTEVEIEIKHSKEVVYKTFYVFNEKQNIIIPLNALD